MEDKEAFVWSLIIVRTKNLSGCVWKHFGFIMHQIKAKLSQQPEAAVLIYNVADGQIGKSFQIWHFKKASLSNSLNCEMQRIRTKLVSG